MGFLQRLLPHPAPALAALALLAFAAVGCGPPSRAQLEANAQRDVKSRVTTQMAALRQAALDIQSAAPQGGAGWTEADRASIENMKSAWKRARVAYESIEGAIAVLFPEIDYTIDQRYDHFLSDNGPDGDPFDRNGVTGMHAIERILWSDQTPAGVVQFESTVPGYQPARFPANAQEAMEFRTGLVQRLIDDLTEMQSQFEPLELDSPAAFRGVIGSLREQVEKVNLAGSSEDESRYAQYTLADMRANLQGSRDTFELFRAWLVSTDGGEALATSIEARFDAIAAQYDSVAGDALPPRPPGYNPDMPSDADRATPYGQLQTMLAVESDPLHEGSIVYLMDQAADAMGIPQLAGN